MTFAPIVIFVYNRLTHTKKVIESLLANEEAKNSDLIIYSDGPKSISENAKIDELRKYLIAIGGFKTITIKHQEKNIGLANSIIQGVSQVLNNYNTVIVVEDDIVVSTKFLSYMNQALDKYENNKDVASIHGYIYPISDPVPNMFFLKGADCWGWATWKRAWSHFEKDGNILKNEIISKGLTSKFNFDDTYPYFKMLNDQINGQNNSWAIRWYASAFLKNMYTLYPGTTLVQNIGFDNSGTHCGTEDDVFYSEIGEIDLNQFPDKIEECITARDAIKSYFIKMYPSQSKNIITQLIKKLKRKLISFIKHE